MFLKLNEQSHSESEVKEDDDHETTSSLTNNDLGQVETKEISRKKKKKKKRKAHRVPANARSSEDNAEVRFTRFRKRTLLKKESCLCSYEFQLLVRFLVKKMMV